MPDNNELEKTLWASANRLRSSMDAAEYKHVVLGLIFLKYISDSFEALRAQILTGEGEFEYADAEDKDEYLSKNIFFVPKAARWSNLLANARDPRIGQIIDTAMDAIEKENSQLAGVLPKIYANPELSKPMLGDLIDLIGNIGFDGEKSSNGDLLGRVYEYFLGQFADAEGKRGGQFYTARCVVQLLVEMLEPYRGRVYDGCCGSGGMFVQSERFVLEHQGNARDLSIFGQESNATTLRLCKMNLAIRGIDARIEYGDTFLNDRHPDLKVDFILANPPFNISDWVASSCAMTRAGSMARHRLATPIRLAATLHPQTQPTGTAAVVMANGSMTTTTSGEYEIAKTCSKMASSIACSALPSQLFYNTASPFACGSSRATNATTNTATAPIKSYSLMPETWAP